MIIPLLALSPLHAADTGTIRGNFADASKVKAIAAVNRANDKKYPGTVDVKSGEFVIDKLPLGGKFDLQIDHGAARLEGVNMKVPRSDYEVEQPLSRDDLAELKREMAALNKFEDVIDILAIKGNIQHAAVVVNKLRTKEFYASKPGEVIWRLEVWQFEKPDETWIKVQEDLFLVLYRERIQRAVYDKKAITLDPSLGGIEVSEKTPAVDLGKILLPDDKPGIRVRESGKPEGGKP